MSTGILVLMIDKAPVDSMSTSEPISYHGHPLSNELSLIKVVSNMNIKDWYLYLLNLSGFKVFFRSLVYELQLLLFGVTIRVLHT